MKLWLCRDTRWRPWGRPRYRFSFKIAVDAEEGRVIGTHKLWRDECYVSPRGLELDAAVESALDRCDELHGAADRRKRIALQRQALRDLMAAEREVRVTVADALVGRTIVAADIVECMMVETGVRAGFGALESKVERLLAYERGEEAIVSGNTEDAAGGAETWADARRVRL